MSGLATTIRPPSSRLGGLAWLSFVVGMWAAFFLALVAGHLDEIWHWVRGLPLLLELVLWLLTFPWLLGTAVWESSWVSWLRLALVLSFACAWTLVSIPRRKEPAGGRSGGPNRMEVVR